jgi:phosphate-selective porin OprO/OprP
MKKLRPDAAQLAVEASVIAMLATTVQTQAQNAVAKNSAVSAAPTVAKTSSIYDQIWGYTEWYRNEENPVIQSFRFTGRFQLDYAVVGEDDFDDLTIRRFRLGGKATLFHHVTLHTEVDLQPELSPVYQKLTDCYLAWSRNPEFLLTVGKQSAPFTMDGSTSSKELITIDRANLANNLWFPQEYIPGVSASGQPGKWRYFLGLFSSGSADKEFGNFDGGVFVLSTLGYDFAEELKVKKAVLTVNYVYNEHDKDNTFTRSLGDVGSVNFNLDSGKWGFRTDLSGGLGFGGQSDLWGAMLMPYYNITPKLQAVARYTFIKEVSKNNCRISMACAILKAWPSI